MLYEYALDPRLLSTLDRVKLFASLFGFAHGRLLSRYPLRWVQMVLAAGNWKPVERKRVEDILDRLIKEAHSRYPQNYREQDDWLKNALTEHGRKSFHAVIASVRSAIHPNVLHGDDLDPTNLPASPAVGSARQVLRSEDGMGAAVRLLFASSRSLQFIDRYLDFAPKYCDPLSRMLGNCSHWANHPTASKVEVEFHTSILPDDRVYGLWRRDFRPRLPANVKLKIVVWNKEYFHNRYLLTEIGGIHIGEGFMLDSSGDRKHDSWTPMDRAHTSEIRTLFALTADKKPAAFVNQFEIK